MPLGEGGKLPHCIRAQDTQGLSLGRVQAHNEVTHAGIAEIDLAQGLFGRQLRGKQAGHAKFGGLRSQRLHEQGQVKVEFSELFVGGLLQSHERWDLIALPPLAAQPRSPRVVRPGAGAAHTPAFRPLPGLQQDTFPPVPLPARAWS